MKKDIVIKVENVSKDFKLPHQKKNSLKSVFTGLTADLFSKDKKSDAFETQHALKNITFDIKKGEFFGIVGRNGSGKSTLLKILAGIYTPNKGSVSVEGKLVPFIELGVGFNPELTGRENVYLNGALLGFTHQKIEAMYDDIVEFAEIEKFMDQKLKNYSSGMQVRLAFSMAIRADADILLVDEVLAVGDAAFQRKCFEYFKRLKANKKTVVFVTHDMSSVREYCDRAMLIDNNEMQLIGDPKDIARDYSMLFIDDQVHTKKGKDSHRWGNGKVKIDKVTAKIVEDDLVIDVRANVSKKVDKMLFGIHIVAQDGTEVTAMNNRMIHVEDLRDLKAGSKIGFSWSILNIFNDGEYSITLTLVDDVGNTLDWITDAGNFTVQRAERSTTSVFPPIKVKTKVN